MFSDRSSRVALLPEPAESAWAASREDAPLAVPTGATVPAAPSASRLSEGTRTGASPAEAVAASEPVPVDLPPTFSGWEGAAPHTSPSAQHTGSGGTITEPPVADLPEILLRGTSPWNDARVDALLDQGAIQADWLPDIRATVPNHLQVQNARQRELLRFSNAIANTGANNWQVRRGDPLTDPAQIAYAQSLGLDPSQLALTAQELLDSSGRIAAVVADAALSEYHPEHRHFHIGETAQFGLERFNASSRSWDPITGLEVVKTTFCLIDVNQIRKVADGDPDHYATIKSPANANVYNDCNADVQGIQAGWIDRYNHSLPGQEVDITGLAAGVYRLVSTVNPAGWFLESDYSNNVGWTAFELSRESNGNAKVREIPGLSDGIWFDHSSNGMG